MVDSAFSQIHTINLREQVVEQIRDAIIEGRLRPNDHIIETELTAQFGVSRTPVREALILLEREGLIVLEPHRGAFVRTFTEQDVSDVFSMRTTLENFAGEQIIGRLTEDDFANLRRAVADQLRWIEEGKVDKVRQIDMAFHRYLVLRSEHPLLIRSWQEIVAQVAALLNLRAEAISGFDEHEVLKDHEAILQALADGDLAALKAENQRINSRVAGQCVLALQVLAGETA